MKVEQISIFLENKSGRLAEVTGVLSKAGINIRALSLADTADFGILRLIVDKTDRAKEVLKQNGFAVSKTEVIGVVVPDRPGGLAEILGVLQSAGINVEYMYAFVQRSGDNAIIIFRFDELDKAIQTLTGGGVRVLKGEELYAL
ncbi:MAG TPA: ACT domain-containing protein [Candidatus Methylomirabilis sp.]|nr:ACT domain-containing protein [Candidatus Methylomirabilis sp.]